MPCWNTLTPPRRRPGAPEDRFDRLLNISQRVGSTPSCENARADVTAIQQLIALAAGSALVRGAQIRIAVPPATGQFTDGTAFWILRLQLLMAPARVQPDGIVYPMVVTQGGVTGGSGGTLYQLNSLAFGADEPAWRRLLTGFPRCLTDGLAP